MSPRIDNTQQVQSSYDANRIDQRDEKGDNSQLMVPASYAAVGGTFELLMLMLEASKAQKDGARQVRSATESSLSQVQAAQVEDIRDKASLQLVGSIATGSMSIAGNTMSTSGTVQSIQAKDYTTQANALQRGLPKDGSMVAPGVSDRIEDLELAGTALEARGATLKGAGDMTSAGSAAVKGLFDSAGTSKEADSTEKQHQADALKRSSERLSSELDGLKGNEDKLISYARDIEAAKSRCTQIALQTR